MGARRADDAENDDDVYTKVEIIMERVLNISLRYLASVVIFAFIILDVLRRYIGGGNVLNGVLVSRK